MREETRSARPLPLAVRAGYGLFRGRKPAWALTPLRGLTIVEMLVAMSITLLIMAAVVTVFANISGSVTRRRATIEMASALRNVRETLARDLAGATCPTTTWQRPESNQGYFELIEGPQNDYYPTPWLWDGSDSDFRPDDIGSVPGIDLALSSLPGSDLGGDPINDEEGQGMVLGSNAELDPEVPERNFPTDGRGLGDADDTLMFTVRNEKQPFVGRIPQRTGNLTPATTTPGVGFEDWGTVAEEVESPLAEVAWFAVENPVDEKRTFAFGEAGYRTIYRRTLLILPDLDYGIRVTPGGLGAGGVAAGPGVVWVLPVQNASGNPLEREDVATALASLIAFQETYDLSVRLEWDPLLPNSQAASGLGRWVIKANTLGDLTKRENRYEHHGYAVQPPSLETPAENPGGSPANDRYFPFAAASAGRYQQGEIALSFRGDAANGSPTASASFQAVVRPIPANGPAVVAYQPNPSDTASDILAINRRYAHRPFVWVERASDTPATARAVLNEDRSIVHITSGLVPLGGARRGDDVMMTEALAFDCRAFDPGAPIYNLGERQIVSPGDPAWETAYREDVGAAGSDVFGNMLTASGPLAARYERQGAYVDLNWNSLQFADASGAIGPGARFGRQALVNAPAAAAGLVSPRFGSDGLIRLATGLADPRTTLFATYDTWSWHYETNGINEDGDDQDGYPFTVNNPNRAANQRVPATDEGANGLDDDTTYPGATNPAKRLGPDDYAERETRPPYDASLRGVQVTLRAYERDSRQIREVRVRESFVPE